MDWHALMDAAVAVDWHALLDIVVAQFIGLLI